MLDIDTSAPGSEFFNNVITVVSLSIDGSLQSFSQDSDSVIVNNNLLGTDQFTLLADFDVFPTDPAVQKLSGFQFDLEGPDSLFANESIVNLTEATLLAMLAGAPADTGVIQFFTEDINSNPLASNYVVAFQSVRELAAVPLPAGVLLLLTGLAGLAVLRCLRAAGTAASAAPTVSAPIPPSSNCALAGSGTWLAGRLSFQTDAISILRGRSAVILHRRQS
ncbi:MAG: VPLPA-CTERM sorting domain-containing protein [Pseudomonadota bacterium]